MEVEKKGRYTFRHRLTGEVVRAVARPKRLKPYVEELWTDETPLERIVFIRTANGKGLGDLVTTLGAVQALRRKHPDVEFVYYGDMPLVTLLENHPDIDSVREWRGDDAIPFGRVIRFSQPCPASLYEVQHEAKTDKSRIELFGMHAGVEAEIPRLFTTEDEDAWARRAVDFASEGKSGKRLGVVLRTAAKWRDYPHVATIYETFDKAPDVTVFPIDHELKTGLRGDTAGLTLRQIMAVIKQMDLVVSPDTGWLHVAAAVGVKVLGLFGSMPPQYRLKPYGGGHEWLTGECPYQRLHCWYDICVEQEEIPPCLQFGPEAVVEMVERMLV